MPRLDGDPAVRRFVAEALRRAGGDVESAARLMLLRLSRTRPEDERVLRLVLAEALEHAAAVLEKAAAARHREARRARIVALCQSSLAVRARGAELRARASELVTRAARAAPTVAPRI